MQQHCPVTPILHMKHLVLHVKHLVLHVTCRVTRHTQMVVFDIMATSDEQFTKERFSGCIAIITGGASGIGAATVKRFANDGATAVIFDVNEKLGREVEISLTSAGLRVELFVVDVSDRDQCIQAVDAVAEKHGKVNYLVNGAVFFGSKGMTARAADWEKTMSVNVQGYSNMVQACQPHMLKAAPSQRAIVNIASGAAHRAQPERWTYSSSKGAQVTLTRNMAFDLSKDGIRVNSISPAWTYTPEVAKAAQNDREKWEPIWGRFHMLRRICEPAEVAAAITYLCSRDASFITAVDLPVDGGWQGMTAEGFGENVVIAISE